MEEPSGRLSPMEQPSGRLSPMEQPSGRLSPMEQPSGRLSPMDLPPMEYQPVGQLPIEQPSYTHKPIIEQQPIEHVPLEEALQKVKDLTHTALSNEQPCIEAESVSIQYQTNFDTNFEDRMGYAIGVARFIEEATVHSDLVSFSKPVIIIH